MKREIELCRGVDIMGARYWSKSSKMFTFLSIFHPEIPLKRRLEIANTYLKDGE